MKSLKLQKKKFCWHPARILPLSYLIFLTWKERPFLEKALNMIIFFSLFHYQDHQRTQAPSINSPKFYNWLIATLKSLPCQLIVTCLLRIPDCFRCSHSMRTIGIKSVMLIILEAILNSPLILGLLFAGMFICSCIVDLSFLFHSFISLPIWFGLVLCYLFEYSN